MKGKEGSSRVSNVTVGVCEDLCLIKKFVGFL